MHNVAMDASQPWLALRKKGSMLRSIKKNTINVRLTKRNKWIESSSSPGKADCLASSEIVKICQCQTMKKPIPHSSRQ